MKYQAIDILLVSYYTLTSSIYYCILYIILCIPTCILKGLSTDYLHVPIQIIDIDSDDSDTEVIASYKKEESKKQHVIDIMKKNNIQSNQFSEDFIGEYTDLFFSIHLKHHKEYKLIQFIKVEILDEYGLIVDMTYRIGFFAKDCYIHIQKLKQYYPDAEFLFLLYKDVCTRTTYRKAIHLSSKKELLENKKCTFGKIMI